MSCTKRAWIVATSIGAVEAMKDQGFARWNYALRCMTRHAKANLGLYYRAEKLSSTSPAGSAKIREKRIEEMAKKVLELNSWGPTTTRF